MITTELSHAFGLSATFKKGEQLKHCFILLGTLYQETKKQTKTKEGKVCQKARGNIGGNLKNWENYRTHKNMI